MAEQKGENQSADNVEEAEELDDEFIPDNARPVCPRCLKPCHPLQYYCDNCDSNDAINPLTPYIGFVNIPFNYGIFLTMWRKIWYEKDTPIIKRIFYFFMIGWFAPVLLIVGLPLLLIGKIEQPKLR